ncbi:uncharacterized protein LOC132704387 [Cylas formicarius]|uniref:uncharacterized protein LOC132704387 n=1 Tax=Cylas formicarius TaxID=197179 RepID=UPI002958982A|nr:uncharacterized protein LOC132704387 [Cylas formicarius]
MKFLVLSSVLTLAIAQFPSTIKPWTGPIADHQLGHLPADTPEVAIAKQQHLKAFSDVLAVLPELPPEERYRMTGLPLPVILQLMQQAREQLHIPVHHQPTLLHPAVEPHLQPVHHRLDQVEHQPLRTTFTQFAEEIPRSPIGEVPEVHAARLAHLKAYQEVQSALL